MPNCSTNLAAPQLLQTNIEDVVFYYKFILFYVGGDGYRHSPSLFILFYKHQYFPVPNCRGRVDYKNPIFNTKSRLLWPSYFTIFCPKFPIFFIFLCKLPETPPFALYYDPSILKKLQKFPTPLLNRRPPAIKHRRVTFNFNVFPI